LLFASYDLTTTKQNNHWWFNSLFSSITELHFSVVFAQQRNNVRILTGLREEDETSFRRCGVFFAWEYLKKMKFQIFCGGKM